MPHDDAVLGLAGGVVMDHLWIEPFAGTAAVALRLLLGHDGGSFVAYMGGKTRYADTILAALGTSPGRGADRVWLIDAGPAGEMWEVLRHRGYRGSVCARLRQWEEEADFCPVALWHRLAALPPHPFPPYRVAQWLWLQARSASSCPVWWDEQLGWRMGDKPRQTAHGQQVIQQDQQVIQQDSASPARPMYHRDRLQGRVMESADTSDQASSISPTLVKTPRGGTEQMLGPRITGGGTIRGMLHPSTIAERIELASDGGFFERLTITRGRVEAVAWPDRLDGAVAYIDPPYVGCTGYAAACSRVEVLRLAADLHRRGARVVLSEQEALDLPGWHTRDITRTKHPEWLTSSSRLVAGPLFALAVVA